MPLFVHAGSGFRLELEACLSVHAGSGFGAGIGGMSFGTCWIWFQMLSLEV